MSTPKTEDPAPRNCIGACRIVGRDWPTGGDTKEEQARFWADLCENAPRHGYRVSPE